MVTHFSDMIRHGHCPRASHSRSNHDLLRGTTSCLPSSKRSQKSPPILFNHCNPPSPDNFPDQCSISIGELPPSESTNNQTVSLLQNSSREPLSKVSNPIPYLPVTHCADAEKATECTVTPRGSLTLGSLGPFLPFSSRLPPLE